MTTLKFRRVTDGRIVAHEVDAGPGEGAWIAVVDARRSTELPGLKPLLREVGMTEEARFHYELRSVSGLSVDDREKLRREAILAKYATRRATDGALAATRAHVPGAFRSLDHPVVLTRRVGLWYYVVDGRIVPSDVRVAPALAADHQRLFDALADHRGSRKTGVARIKVTKSPYAEHVGASVLYVSVADDDLHRFVLRVDPGFYEIRRERRQHTKSSQYVELDRWHGRVVGTQLAPIKAPPIDVAIVLQQLFDAALAYWEKHPLAASAAQD